MTVKRVAQLLWRGAVAALTVTVTATVTAAAFDGQTLHYAAKYGDIDAGAATVSITVTADGYRVESNAKPNALAKLFGAKSHATVTRFIRGDGGAWTLDSGHENHGDGDARRFRIDHAAGRIEFGDGEQHTIAPGERLESAAFPLLLMLRAREAGVDSIADLRVTEVNARRAREYIYAAPVAERVKTSTGAEKEAWKITRHRADRPADSVTIWLRRRDNIPMKIMLTKNNRSSSLLLTANES